MKKKLIPHTHMKTKTLILSIVTFLFFLSSCSDVKSNQEQSSSQDIKEREDLSKIIAETTYERYFLFKGDNLATVQDGLNYWSETYRIDWVVKESKYKDWTLVKMVKEDIVEVTDYHNMPSLFFNTPGDPVKLSDEDVGIAIAIDPKGENTYLAYITKEIFESSREIDPMSCDLYGVFQNNEKGIMSACFPEVLEPTGRKIPDFEEVLNQYGIDLEEIQSDSLSGEIIEVKSSF
jgi:hypothetical protein